jgi:uncharacterized protein YccT (UPF0319 family)
MKKIILLLCLFAIPFSHAAVLTGTNNVEILAVDGNKIDGNRLTRKDIIVEKGKHQIVLQYSGVFKKNKGVIESKPHIFTFEIKGDTHFSTQKFSRSIQAERAIKAGLVWKATSNGKTIEITGSDSLNGSGFMPYSQIEKLIADYNQTNENTTANIPAIAPAPKNSKTTKDDLIKLYNSANKEERRAFRVWLIE